MKLDNGKSVNGYTAHKDCIHGNRKLCQSTSYPQAPLLLGCSVFIWRYRPQELYEDDWTAQNAATLIRRAPSNKPWFIWVNFPVTH